MLSHIVQSSIRGRGLVLLGTLLVAALGAVAFRDLPIDAVPDITNNQVQINTSLPELSPVEIEKQVTFPIESSLAGIPGIESTRSLSRNGFSQVTAIFRDDVDVYFARTQVNERLSSVRDRLPPGAEPRMGAISTGLGEIYMWSVEYQRPEERVAVADGEPGWQKDGDYVTPERERLHTEVERLAWLRTVQDWVIRPQLQSVPGVAGVDAIGGYVKEYHVEPDAMAMVSYGITFADLIEALERNNVSTGAGYVEHGGESWTVRAAGRIATIDEISRIAVGSSGGVPIRIQDVARVRVGRELRTGSASSHGEEVVIGTALMLIGANSRTVALAVDDRLERVRATLPNGVVARTVLNRTKLVNATIETVAKNLIEGAALVIVVLLLLLGHVRAALICAAAIPLSMAMTAIGMVKGKISGNLMSLGAIDFGLIVDGAIIIVENSLRRLAHRQHEAGRTLTLTLAERVEEVTVATREMVRPSLFGQAIIATVYLPILALTGVEGKMFHPMALTVLLALGAAFVLSVTFVPASVALFVRGRVREKEGLLVRAAKRLYAPTLVVATRARAAVVLLAIGAFLGSLLLARRLGQEFVPTLDERDIALHAMRIPSTALGQATSMQLDLERTISAFPEVATVFSKTGTAEMAADPMPPNVSDTFIVLKPRADWPDPNETKESFRERLEAGVAALPGNNYEWTQPIQMRFNELLAGVRGDVAVKVFGDDFDAMQRSAQEIAGVLARIPGAADVKVEQTEGLPVMSIDVDRNAVARYGLDVADVQDAVAVAIGGRSAGSVFQGDRRFDLAVRLPEEVRRDVAAIEDLPIPVHRDDREPEVAGSASSVGATGDVATPPFIPLRAVASVSVAEGVNQVSRENGKRRVVVQCNVRGRDLGSFVAQAQEAVRSVRLPPGGFLAWGGQFENLVAARERLSVVVPLCFGLILLLLYGAFRSVRDALLVFSGVPLGLTGGIIALFLRDMPFSISAAVGFIALSGVAVLNGLVMVTSIDRLREEGAALDDAIRHGALGRLRPVLMTALVASLGFVPMALATGTGAEVQKPLATVVIGGLVSSTLLTLVVLPALYRMFARRAVGGAGGWDTKLTK